ncbi:polyketide synthase dehydratase domain-containing protein, partial [Actinomadura sp. LOL_011]|uniref:polyketide synthase dehydratase domain-containing protein n=1 Tax=Actinomadura sp. LOL_011 TaxID=3345410 RepID=UPI003A8033DC
GTAYLELAIHAGDHTATPHIHELTLQAPMALRAGTPLQLQVTVQSPDGNGHRALTIHSRPASGDTDEPWTCHATGTLAAATSTEPTGSTTWPPPGAEPISTENLYQRFDDLGLNYGPLFQGVHTAWRT